MATRTLPRLPLFLDRLRAEPGLSPAPLVDYLLEHDATLPDVLRLYAGDWPHADPVWQEILATWLDVTGDRKRAAAVRVERAETNLELQQRLDLSALDAWDDSRAERDRKRRTLALFCNVKRDGRPLALVFIARNPAFLGPNGPPPHLVEHAATLGYPVPEAVRWRQAPVSGLHPETRHVIFPHLCHDVSVCVAEKDFARIVCEACDYHDSSGRCFRYWLGRCPGKCRTVAWGVQKVRDDYAESHEAIRDHTLRSFGVPSHIIAGDPAAPRPQGILGMRRRRR